MARKTRRPKIRRAANVVTEAELRRLGALSPECEQIAQVVRDGVAILRREALGMASPLRGTR